MFCLILIFFSVRQAITVEVLKKPKRFFTQKYFKDRELLVRLHYKMSLVRLQQQNENAIISQCLLISVTLQELIVNS